jgi:hypothetical protein
MLALTVGYFQGLVDRLAYFGLVSGMIVWWYYDRSKSKNPPAAPS